MLLTKAEKMTLDALLEPVETLLKQLRARECELSQTLTVEQLEEEYYNFDNYEDRLFTVARSLARRLLEAAEVDGLGGCMLCQS